MTYDVEVIKERFWSGTLDQKRLTSILNDRADNGWKYDHSLTASRRVLLVFKRDAYFLIFSKEGQT